MRQLEECDSKLLAEAREKSRRYTDNLTLFNRLTFNKPKRTFIENFYINPPPSESELKVIG